ncbi:MAG TPA: hypothetical protein VG713_12995 [Pirellulales bacterium]|nr:hypothetical protein [Pirellulales bacterium]
MRSLCAMIALCLWSCGAAARAQDFGPSYPPTTLRSGSSYFAPGGVFVGIGGSGTSVTVNNSLYASGNSSVYTNGMLVASGNAGGAANPSNTTQSTFAPVVQAGFLINSRQSNWAWGTKFQYRYLGLTYTQNGIDSPQANAFTSSGTFDSFTGRVIVGSSQTAVNHEFALFPLIGRRFGNGLFYFGGGPVVFETESKIYNAIGFANVNGAQVEITGTPANFASTTWMWGGGAQIGLAYNITPRWFIDVSYDAVVTGTYTNNYSSAFSSSSTSGGNVYTDSGALFLSNAQKVYAQSLTVTINRSF